MLKPTKLMFTVFFLLVAFSVLPGCVGYGWGCGPARAALGFC